MIKEFCYYYFWDKKLSSVAEIFISHVDSKNIYFSYRGKKYHCSQEYASRKLYDEPHLVPVFSDVDKTDYSSFVDITNVVKDATMTYVMPTGSYYDHDEVESFYRNAYDDALGFIED